MNSAEGFALHYCIFYGDMWCFSQPCYLPTMAEDMLPEARRVMLPDAISGGAFYGMDSNLLLVDSNPYISSSRMSKWTSVLCGRGE